jgi:enoyl-CoA hydratase/carnithine racemase
MAEHVETFDETAIRTVRLNRPDKKNALTVQMYAALASALRNVNTDPKLRCIVLFGGPEAFCAGNDLTDFAQAANSGVEQSAVDFLHALATCEKPLVAAVRGLAIGVGTTMLLHCDHVIASTGATFSTPFVKLGLIPEAASTLLAPRLMGHRRAFELLVMGRRFDAEAARSCGIVNTIVPDIEVEEAAMSAAREIANLAPDAVRASRRLMRVPGDQLVDRINEEVRIFNERLGSPEAAAAFKAFFAEKSKSSLP